jgi:hypothetical protein
LMRDSGLIEVLSREKKSNDDLFFEGLIGGQGE